MNTGYLISLIKPLSNKEIAGTYGRQVPTENRSA